MDEAVYNEADRIVGQLQKEIFQKYGEKMKELGTKFGNRVAECLKDPKMDENQCLQSNRSLFEVKNAEKAIRNRDLCFIKADEAYSKNKDQKLLFNNISSCLNQYKDNYLKEFGDNIEQKYNELSKYTN